MTDQKLYYYWVFAPIINVEIVMNRIIYNSTDVQQGISQV